MAFPNAFEKHGMGRFMPSGVTSWTPASLGSNLKGWWKADAGVRARTAAQFTSANSETLSSVSNSSLQTGDVDFWCAGWIYIDTDAIHVFQVKGKGGSGIDASEYAVCTKTNASLTLEFYINGTIAKKHSVALSTATWYHYFCYYDSVNDLAGVILNATTAETASSAGPLASGAGQFTVGGDTVGGRYHNGRMGNVAFGKSPGAGIASLASTIASALYNSGNGARYADISSANRTAWGLVSWWELDENSGTRADKHGSNTLTDNNTVTANDGKVDYAAADGDAVWKWEDQSGNSKHFLQTTQAKKPLFKTGIQNSRACLLGDGVDDIMAVGSVVSAATTFSCAAAMQVVVREADPTMFMNGTVGATGWALDTHASLRSITSQGVGFNAGSTDTNTFEIWVVTRNLTGPAWVLRVDGAADALTPSNAAMNAPATNTTIFGTPSETRIVNAYGGEFLIVDALLTAGEIAQLESYLNTRWASF